MLNARVLLERRGETILEGLIGFEDFGESLNFYLDLLEEFETVKNHYSGFMGFFRKTLIPTDQESLFNCVRTLREIANHPSVISQSRDAGNLLANNQKMVEYEGTLMCHVHKLRRETENYLREFGSKIPYDL